MESGDSTQSSWLPNSKTSNSEFLAIFYLLCLSALNLFSGDIEYEVWRGRYAF
jgi:hypothetical protein